MHFLCNVITVLAKNSVFCHQIRISTRATVQHLDPEQNAQRLAWCVWRREDAPAHTTSCVDAPPRFFEHCAPGWGATAMQHMLLSSTGLRWTCKIAGKTTLQVERMCCVILWNRDWGFVTVPGVPHERVTHRVTQLVWQPYPSPPPPSCVTHTIRIRMLDAGDVGLSVLPLRSYLPVEMAQSWPGGHFHGIDSIRLCRPTGQYKILVE